VGDAQRTAAAYPEGSEVTIDLAAIPNHVREELAAATLDSVIAFLRQPGGRKFLDEKKAALKAAKRKEV